MRVGFAVGNQTLKIGFQLGKPPLEITGDPQEIAGVLDAFDRLFENMDFRMHDCFLDSTEKMRRASDRSAFKCIPVP